MDNHKKYKLILEDKRVFSFVSKVALMSAVKKHNKIKFIFKEIYKKSYLNDPYRKDDPFERVFYCKNGRIEK